MDINDLRIKIIAIQKYTPLQDLRRRGVLLFNKIHIVCHCFIMQRLLL